ncbi:hypothetical protein Rxycam_02448 [Rubrobacter xylanophilus DSM 9941]|uniref:histidine phosphatase family protein n=1 Tax=Rubrobacter xylanophilus TaxID=49319 RepID=UPI001C63B999|nr:histidine phosphatase family protein [Rubrobacter xylanophilus]QYJ16613.1 hypothetical protein Rxycam_02448 [Rubrobacter xylanophilus DSM 9941]
MPDITVHWVRHGEIPSHRGDVALTEKGLARAREWGRSLAGELSPGETVHFMYAPTLRTRQTAEGIHSGIAGYHNSGGLDLHEPAEQYAIRNPDLYVAGQRVEMVSTPEALARQLSDPPLDAKTLSDHPFFREFWASPDRVGYWVRHPDPPGEDAAAVARRQMMFVMSLLERPGHAPVRYVLSTHSPVMRAVLLFCAGEDPGEPEFLESLDLFLSDGGPAVLCFRDVRRVLPPAGSARDR